MPSATYTEAMLDTLGLKNYIKTESSCFQIEAELQTLNVDLQHTYDCLQRHGDVFLPAYRHLFNARETKKIRYREIISQLEAIKAQVDASQSLLHSLQSSAMSVRPVTVSVNVSRH